MTNDGYTAKPDAFYAKNQITIQHIDTLPKYGKKLSMYVGPRDVYLTIYVSYTTKLLKKNFKGLSTIFSLQTVFCYQCIES